MATAVRFGVGHHTISSIEYSPFKPYDKLDLLMTALGERPACVVGLSAKPGQVLDPRQAHHALQAVVSTHLEYDMRKIRREGVADEHPASFAGLARINFTVSSDRATVDQLRRAVEEEDTVTTWDLTGQLKIEDLLEECKRHSTRIWSEVENLNIPRRRRQSAAL